MRTITLRDMRDRRRAIEAVQQAPHGAHVSVREPSRTNDQNAKMHAMLADIARAQPGGRKMTPDRWKAVMMQACNHECMFEIGLDGRPFPIGFRSSQLSVAQMGQLIEFMYWFGAQNDVAWSEPHPDERQRA